ncbi:transcriptional regulator [Phyllobacterium phragmitis]|uniref:Transcriptional regulator n=1 Tax=Phyllobacterium phragmitis TaxID=2670329 RepID=A0A2S9IPM4_9HYPH|nr:LysR substrate-binding domain-containing protein [Phyllobacterium phragmitis]PRD42479.1 transcriptional regulator [Phyllobacterium phragmitis]
MPINPNLNSLAYFEAVARTGRVSLAAAELGVSAAAVSQQLKQLEEQWGVRLFRRKDRRLSLTIDGEMLYQTTTTAFRMIRGARSAVLRQRSSRQLTIRSSPSFAVRWLTPRLKHFLDANPEWGLRVDATPDFSDFETEVVDLDLRYGSGSWEGLHTECIINDFVLPMCSPAYRDQMKALSDDPTALFNQARLIHSVKALYQWDVWLIVHGIDPPTEQAPLRFDRSSMAIQLARDGAGIVLDSATLAQEDLERGTLVPLSTVFDVVEFPAYWVVCPPRHANRRTVRLFTDWIRDEGSKFDRLTRTMLHDLGCRFRHAKDEEPGLR